MQVDQSQQPACISIHALREEGDVNPTNLAAFADRISIHALREEGDGAIPRVKCHLPLFLSTPSARRATGGNGDISAKAYLISIHALREEGDMHRPVFPDGSKHISIHALREEGDKMAKVDGAIIKEFLSTPSARRATKPLSASCFRPVISIHALREEGDTPLSPRCSVKSHFYPRPPRGGRQQKQRQNLYFQTNYTTFCTNLEEP